jgi:ribosomal protein L19
MLRNLFSSLFDFNSRKDLKDEHVEEKVVAAPVKKNSVSTPTISKYDADIESLKTTYGDLKPGMVIEITLQDLLTICPRNRRRIEAYQGLVTALRKQGVTLTITSNKTK